MHLVNYQEASLVAYLHKLILTGFSKTIKATVTKAQTFFVNYPEAYLVGYLYTFNINWIFKTRKSRTHNRHLRGLNRGFPEDFWLQKHFDMSK